MTHNEWMLNKSRRQIKAKAAFPVIAHLDEVIFFNKSIVK